MMKRLITTQRVYKQLMLALFLLRTGALMGEEVNTGKPLNNLQQKSNQFEVRLSDQPIFTEQFKDVNYALIEYRAAAPLAISYKGEIQSFEISPAQYSINGKLQDNTIRFELNRTGYFVVTVNKVHRLFIFVIPGKKNNVDSTEKLRVNIASFGLDGSGKKVETQKLQIALDAIAGSGKILYFPPGVYKTGTLSIRSNTKIYLAAGAMIKGSEDRTDYPVDPGFKESDAVNDKENYTDNGERMTFSRLILIDQAKNVEIKGRGVIDGSGSVLRPLGKPANLIRIRNSSNIYIEGIILRDPAAWNTHILYSDSVVMRNVKILNDRSVANTDGVDPDASRNVLIDHCFAYCSDDNIAIKTSNNGSLLRDLENITVRNCIFLTKKSSLKVGTETKSAVMKNITFENNDVIESDRGMALYCSDGATFENIRFINNRFEHNYPDSQQKSIQFSIKNRSGAGHINNVLIKDCTFLEPFPKPSEMIGLDKDHGIANVRIENLVIGGKKCRTLEEAQIGKTAFTTHLSIVE